jgi:hypothetical protein|tara:strand:- start:145 stop:342 length:198 start_codon:yes stop_codon:yes gene_type:complete
MNIGKTVKVVCEDTGQTQSGTVVSISKNNVASIDINPKLPLMLFFEAKPNVWVCNSVGLEFVVRV